MEECLVHELVLDRINLSNLNYLCCLTPDIKYLPIPTLSLNPIYLFMAYIFFYIPT